MLTPTHTYIQLRFPVCRSCGALHLRMLDYCYAEYCQNCMDKMWVEAFYVRFAPVATDAAALEWAKEQRPDLFPGLLPGYWQELKERHPVKKKPKQRKERYASA